jgi:hypothetical protein
MVGRRQTTGRIALRTRVPKLSFLCASTMIPDRCCCFSPSEPGGLMPSKNGGTRRSRSTSARVGESPWSSPCYKSILLDNFSCRDPNRLGVDIEGPQQKIGQQHEIQQQCRRQKATTTKQRRQHTMQSGHPDESTTATVSRVAKKTGPERKLWVKLKIKTTSGGVNESGTRPIAPFLPHAASSWRAGRLGVKDRQIGHGHLANRTLSMAERGWMWLGTRLEHVGGPEQSTIRPGHAIIRRMDWTGCFGAVVGKEE